MAYEYITVQSTEDNRLVEHTYIICAGCRMPVDRDPASKEWAAWDAPDIQVDTGKRDDAGHPVTLGVEQWEVALCSECYGKAHVVRYPGSVPPKLYDGRVEGAAPIPVGSAA